MNKRGTILLRVAFPIIIAGLFVVVTFWALNYEALTIEIYAVLILVAIFIFLFGFAIGQEFSFSVRRLLEEAEKLSRGEMPSKVYLETKDEFERLANIFNKIVEEMQKKQAMAEQAESLAEIKIRAKSQELEAIIKDLEEKLKNRAQEFQKVISESEELRKDIMNREREIIELKRKLRELEERRRVIRK